MTRTPGPPALPGLSPVQPVGSPTSPAPFNAAAFNPAVLVQDAVRAHEAGRRDEAERGYRLALKIAPKDVRALAYLGTLMMEQGRWSEGLELLDQTLAIDPRQANMLTNRGQALIELGRFEEAMAAYEAAIALQPVNERGAGYNDMGAYLHALGRETDALYAYDKALAVEPNMAEALANRAVSLLALKRPDEAMESLERAIALKPGFADALTNRGIALYQANRLEDALADFDRALALKPDGAEIYNNKGLALQSLDRLDEALACADRAVALQPGMAESVNNRGMALQALDRWREALAAYDEAIALKPDYAEPHWNKCLVLLRAEDYEHGWPLFEWRWKRPGALPEPTFDRPLWLGKPSLAGKTILLHAEQGYGDTIHMLRYVTVLARKGARVLLCAPEALAGLAVRIEGINQVLGHLPPAGGFDFHCPLMSLPLALGARVETIPADIPYLSVPPAKTAEWQARLGPKTRRRIGLAWSGNVEHKNDRNRSIPLGKLLPLLAADADFFSVQKDYRDADAALLKADGRIRDFSADLGDFTDTAALVEQMDLVISVDTSVAHLAGALGKPLYILLTQVGDYRWHMERSDSPWYPTARLIRQTRHGDWDGVVAEAAEAIGAGAAPR